MNFNQAKGAITKRGGEIIAQTRHKNGISYDAVIHYRGKKHLIQGPIAPDPEQAMVGLFKSVSKLDKLLSLQ